MDSTAKIKNTRSVTIDDAAEVLSIYAPYVESTTISFETSVPTLSEIEARITKTLPMYPWLIYERDQKVLGYAYASQHRAREAYLWSVDVAVYVRQTFTHQGIGRDLYQDLLMQLQCAGYANAFAGIALPNDASIALHESRGFVPIGIYKNVGYKHGTWLDVGWWQRSFEHPKHPFAPKPTLNCSPIP